MSDEKLDAHATYRELIDTLVQKTPSMWGTSVRERGNLGRIPDPVQPQPWRSAEDVQAAEGRRQERIDVGAFVGRLDAGDRAILARLLDEERSGGIHDVLATLTWYLDCRDVEWSVRGEPMPIGYEGGLHYDYVGRVAGDWPWPETDGDSGSG